LRRVGSNSGHPLRLLHWHIEYNQFGSPIMRLPKEVELVAAFLFSNVDGSIQEYYLSAIDRVLEGKAPYSEAGGNIYRLEIEKDLARVIDTLADDQTEHRGSELRIKIFSLNCSTDWNGD
jgi:hypothetical protein